MSKDQNKDEPEKSSALHTIIDRLALGPIWRKFFVRRVPKARWYYGDGATLLFLLGILIVTGFALGLMYSPSPETAYQSLVHITKVQAMGWFVRGLHYWSAGMMVVI
ncbi:MAG: hypothetical protein M3Q07_26265, partial [Pseudobdellovibrionaceae bacterium]|nr:hypothetical protein [Pseudobdellovibrionaceae bacterium]